MNTNVNVERNPFIAPQAELEDSKTQVDEEFQLDFFSASGRIGRIRYLAYSMGLGMLVMLVAGILTAISRPLLFLAYPGIMYVNLMLAIKRSHDFNVTGWVSLLVFVPLLNLIFLFIPGTDGPNRYGNKTAPNRGAAWILVIAMIGIFVIGILAAIALPAYQQYVERARAAQVR